MNFAILRTQKLKSGIAVRRSLRHAFREQETPNADPSRTPDNTHIGAAGVEEALANFNARLATQEKVRKNAVLAVEYLITASPEAMAGKSRQAQDTYFRDALTWLEEKHGKANVVYAGIHRDETTPHMYAYVVPLDERGKLNCRSFLGGAKALSQMQTDFSQQVGQRHELARGIEGSKARHTSIQQYYTRATQAFEQLPEVKTPAPQLRPEPEKPGLLAGSAAKEAYRADHAAWLREQGIAELQRDRRKAEIKAQRDAAVETAKRHQAQAKEAAALKAEVGQLKRSNGAYAKKAAERKAEVVRLVEIAELFSPEEIRAAEARKRAQEAEKARQTELGRVEAQKAAKKALIASERARRVEGIQALLRSAGAAHTFGVKAAAALREAGGDVDKVKWASVEGAAIRDAMGKYGQSAESVIEAINKHSPIRANPRSHQNVADWVNEKAPELRRQYERGLDKRQDGPRFTR